MGEIESRRGGKRAGAGRPRNLAMADVAEIEGVSRATAYRWVRYASRLSPEAIEFARNRDHTRLITGKALDIAGWFNVEDQIEVLKFAIDRRRHRKALTHAAAVVHLQSKAKQ